jgi:two-component system, NarL family, response regulator DevR
MAPSHHRRMQPEPGRPAPLRVVVVDADDRVRESLAGLLCIGDRLCVVGSAGATGPAIDLVTATKPDIVVIDPRLPEVDGGLTLIRRIRVVAPAVRILVMSGASAGDQADLARSADGFVRKTFRPRDLVAAVIAAAVPFAS